jgi:hypothetical protein
MATEGSLQCKKNLATVPYLKWQELSLQFHTL